LRSRGQTSRSLGTRMLKSFFVHIFVKCWSIYVKMISGPLYTSSNTFRQWNMSFFVIICNPQLSRRASWLSGHLAVCLLILLTVRWQRNTWLRMTCDHVPIDHAICITDIRIDILLQRWLNDQFADQTAIFWHHIDYCNTVCISSEIDEGLTKNKCNRTASFLLLIKRIIIFSSYFSNFFIFFLFLVTCVRFIWPPVTV